MRWKGLAFGVMLMLAISCAPKLRVGDACGDGIVAKSELCDDGNTVDDDGCSASCTVESGWNCDTSPSTCTGIDECSAGTDNCDDHAMCTNTLGSFTCVCDEGYAGDGVACTDIDECAGAAHNCDAHATCTNTLGSFTCACDEGYAGDGVACTDIDECAGAAHNCDAHATCTNTLGSFTCVCNGGYAGDGVACSDIDECASAGHNCDANAMCTNTLGSFTCACYKGYCGDGVTCFPEKVVVQIVAGDAYTCARLNDGSVKCWGTNAYGQLGLGDIQNRGNSPSEMGCSLPAINLGAGKTALAISAGWLHTCALLNDGSVKCWGGNAFGQLGLGDTQNRGDSPSEMGDNLPQVNLGANTTALAISAGWFHTCALLNNGSVKCWGYNVSGQLGLGDTQNRGDGPSEMGDTLLPVNLGTNTTALAISAGWLHTCALLNGDRVKCWGGNPYGQLGLGDTQNRGDGPSEMGDTLLPISLDPKKSAKAVSAGCYSTCAILDDGSVKCWGGNGSGQLGLGDTKNRGDGVNEMGNNLPAIILGTDNTAVAISASFDHTCTLLNDGHLKCWGSNKAGQLGLGDTQNRGDGPSEMGDNLPAINLSTDKNKTAVAISAGVWHTCALLNDGRVKCWGYNASGQLGLGNTQNRGDSPGEMGDNLPPVLVW